MTFRTAADSDRVHARKGERERGERKRRERSEQKCLAAAAAAAATHCKAPVHRRVREYYALFPSAMDRPSNASNLRGYCCYLTVTLCAAQCQELRHGAATRRTRIDGSVTYRYAAIEKSDNVVVSLINNYK